MAIIKYISANIFSFIGHILILDAICLIFLQNRLNIPELADLDTIALGLNLSALLIPLLILQPIEWLIRRYKPCLLPKMKVCKYCRLLHCIMFSIGYMFAIICSYFFLLIMTPALISEIKNII